MKQETLEEFIEKTIDESFEIELASSKIEKYMNLAVKWQQERSYSEEEVKHIVSEALQSALVKFDLEQWFEQFKKK